MFALATPLWQIVLRTAVVYTLLLIGLRFAGKREIGQMTVFDLVVVLLIANAVQNAMVGPDTSLTGGLVAAGVLLVINFVVSRLQWRSPRLRRLIEGTPTLLISHGAVIPAHLRKEAIDLETLEAALREHGFDGVEKVESAVLEIDGSISVIPKETEPTRIKKPHRALRKQ